MDHVTLRKVRHADRSLGLDAIMVTLFRDGTGEICGWYLGPVRIAPSGVRLPYLPRSKGTRGAVAVIRALEDADQSGLEVCIVDPEDLWDAAWAS